MNTSMKYAIPIVLTFALLGGCSSPNIKPAGENPTYDEQVEKNTGKLFGDIVIGGGAKRDSDGGPSGIGVNGFLWRASLDTLAFLPLASADPFGGVIITDWYAPPESPNERFKVTVYLLGRQLRSDGIRVSVFRQTQQSGAGWADSALSEETATKLADSILTRARELRIAGGSG